MPRLENEGFNPNRNNREDFDRTVPTDENYYGNSFVDLDFNNRESRKGGINPTEDFDIAPSQRSAKQRNVYEQENIPPRRQQSSNHNNSRQRSSKKRVPPKKIAAAVVAVLLVIVIAVVSCGFSVLGKFNYKDREENAYVDSSQLVSDSKVKNILLLGVDARSGDNQEASRSDVMMLVSVDSKHNCIKMTSFLRDTWVYIPTLDKKQRLNAACSSGGYQGVVDAIEYNFGVAVDGYAVVDFEMFKVLVDSLGGVEVNVTKAEAKEVTNHKVRYGHVVLKAGKHNLTGEQALAYCRIRKIDSDFGRTQRQRTVMSAILSKAKRSPLKLYSMASNSAPYVETNLSKSELMSIGLSAVKNLGGEYLQNKVPFENTWWYDNIDGNSVIGINVEENKEKLIDYIYNKSAEEIKAEQKESE